MVRQNLELYRDLIAGLWSEDPLIRMRAADATEKLSRNNRSILLPYRKNC